MADEIGVLERIAIALEAIAAKLGQPAEEPKRTPFPWGNVSVRCRRSLSNGVHRDPSEFESRPWPWSCEDLIEMGATYLLEVAHPRNFGRKTAEEIAGVLKNLGVHDDWMST